MAAAADARRSRTARPKNLIFLTQQLGMLIQAGLSLDRALEMVLSVVEGKTEQDAIRAVLDRVRGGSTLADAMAAQNGLFPAYYIGMVRAGRGQRLARYHAASSRRVAGARGRGARAGEIGADLSDAGARDRRRLDRDPLRIRHSALPAALRWRGNRHCRWRRRSSSGSATACRHCGAARAHRGVAAGVCSGGAISARRRAGGAGTAVF